MLKEIYSIKGKHFKVYNNKWREVLEHPSDTEEVSLSFEINKKKLDIVVKDYIYQPMRIPGQKERIDIYILQEYFKPFLNLLEEEIKMLNIEYAPKRNWRFNDPSARPNRQVVPKIHKLAEVRNVSALVPFQNEIFDLKFAFGVIDSEVPNSDQTKWKREGGFRQIHIGIIMGYWNSVNSLFSWDEIQENNTRIIEFLQHRYNIDWIKKAKIDKIDDVNIRASYGENYLSLRLNDEKNMVYLELHDGRNNKFIVKMDNSKPNIYDLNNEEVRITIPISEMKYNFIESIKDNWIE